ncbi:MAG: hypothetical protein IJX35_05495 [Candidatus Methanomethylophilaceae archaeon]|nr:hypothetical protein [Candidatus Methanomethylophilaceae archaeon]
MISVSEDLDRFLAKVKGYAEYVDNEIADRENDFRSMCFWNIYNRAVMTKEIVTFYTRTWEKIDVPIDLGPEITERIVTVTKDLFVDTVSSIEKASKDCVNAYKLSGLRDRSMIGKSYLYLRNIISSSVELGYTTEDDGKEWDNILLMRNLVTHNNSVADRSMVFEVNGLRISMRPNGMMKGPSNTFVVLTDRVTDLFNEWLTTVDGVFG